MTTSEGEQPTPKPRRVGRGKQPPSPVNINPGQSLTPTDRLDAMTRERVKAIEDDKTRLLLQIDGLQIRIDDLHRRIEQLTPENARLLADLYNAETNNVLSTILIGLGGFTVSYATFTGNAAPAFAHGSAGCLLAGILVMFWQSFRRWRRP